jgi:DNA-binding NarL/FixJ family response regulator
VEDDYLVAMQMESALTEAGFDVTGLAGSADEAIALVVAERPILVVMDVRLRGERDGIDAALELFTKYGIRCVFATAYHTPEARARAEAAEPLAWVRKPYTMPALVEVVRTAFRGLTND